MSMSIGMFIVRVIVGGLFIGHGTQKLFGWFGGGGPAGTGRIFEQIGYTPGRQMALLAGCSEAGAGTLLVLGFMTPLGAAAIVGVMVGTLAVHLPKGLWNTNGGFELPLVFAAAAIAIGYVGPGRASFDALIGWPVSGFVIGTAAAAFGIVTGGIMLSIRSAAIERAEAVKTQRAA
ncbi:MAG: DoxX family protein [Actinomycetota bacterium]